MPYNNTPITPAKEVTGAVSLPLARVKKIIATDDEISNCSNNAAFVITVAAEMFLQHLVEQSYNIVKSDSRNGKARRNIQYRDVASAVSRVENLEFLTDVVPKTTTYRTHKQKQSAARTAEETTPAQPDGDLGPSAAGQSNGLPPGQRTLDAQLGIGGSARQATNGASHENDGEAMDVDVDVDINDVPDSEDEEIEIDSVDDGDGGSMVAAKSELEPKSRREPVKGVVEIMEES